MVWIIVCSRFYVVCSHRRMQLTCPIKLLRRQATLPTLFTGSNLLSTHTIDCDNRNLYERITVCSRFYFVCFHRRMQLKRHIKLLRRGGALPWQVIRYIYIDTYMYIAAQLYTPTTWGTSVDVNFQGFTIQRSSYASSLAQLLRA